MVTYTLLADILRHTQYRPPKFLSKPLYISCQSGATTIYFLSEWRRCVADMKNPRMVSTLAYVPFGDLIEAAQMRHYHKKYHKK